MPFCCKFCNKVFVRQFTLNRHIREVHNEENEVGYAKERWNFKCLEEKCDMSFSKGPYLISHLENVHDLKFEHQTIFFKTMEEFYLWKQSFEAEFGTFYVVSAQKKDKGIIYYNCNRSKTGHDRKRDEQKQYKRNLKSQGLFHIDSLCTSQMKVLSIDGQITVNFQKRHYGHDVNLAKIRLPKNEREKIAFKLLNGVPPKKIVQSVYENIGDHLKRIDLLTMTDVNNIKSSFGIESEDGKRHENDAVSVDLWVTENMSKLPDENQVLFYKKQGIQSSVLNKEDFCLIIMNKFQKAMLNKFGNDTLTIDGTHGLNQYDFELTTLMVLDEFKQGFPVAFMFSNKKDTQIYQIFFQQIKQSVGEINTKIFMSDLAEAYFKAWMSVMNTSDTQHIYCAWHIDRAWQSNIKKVKSVDKQKSVKQAIKILQQNTEKEEFETCLHNTILLLLNDEETEEFGIYFQTNYASNYRKWAYCFREHCVINTNMHVESMHKVLKYIYANRKTVRRLDKGLNIILQFLTDKCRERIVKLVKGKNTNCTKDIFQRHCEAQKLETYKLEYSENVWKVKNNDGKIYQVRKKQEFNCCLDICTICKICRHIYMCDCPDSNKKLICKHIHFVLIKNKHKAVIQAVESCDTELFYTSLNKVKEAKEEKINKKINDVFCKLNNFNYTDLEHSTLDNIYYHLNIVENLIKLPNKANIQNNFISKGHSNKRNIEPQLRFESTKKKKNSKSSTITLSQVERMETKKMLENKPSLFILSNPKEEHCYFKKM